MATVCSAELASRFQSQAAADWAAKAKAAKVDRLELDEKNFRWLLNENAMATEKTAEGIRKFAADVVKLEKFVASKL